jgi:hypothetical protein
MRARSLSASSRSVGIASRWKLLIDKRHQGRGYGSELVRQVANLVRAEGATQLFTSIVSGDGGPAGFYEKTDLCRPVTSIRTTRSSSAFRWPSPLDQLWPTDQLALAWSKGSSGRAGGAIEPFSPSVCRDRAWPGCSPHATVVSQADPLRMHYLRRRSQFRRGPGAALGPFKHSASQRDSSTTSMT